MSPETGPTAVELTRHDDARLNIYCFPPAGMGPGFYLPWAAAVPPSIGIHAIHLPGRESHPVRIPDTDPRRLTKAIADRLGALNGPFAFFGHSSGSLLAFETVLQLRRNGSRLPVRLAVSGIPAPHDGRQKTNIIDLVLGGLENGQDVAPILPHDPAIGLERRAAHYSALVADSLLILNHRHHDEEPIDVPVSIYAGEDDPLAPTESLDRWNDLVGMPATPRLFPGGHMYLADQGLAVLAQFTRELAHTLDSGLDHTERPS